MARGRAGAARGGPALSVRGLRKAYGEIEAVAGLDLEVARGEVFALLGPNGAGKTTTLEILEGYRRRSDGDVSVLGLDPETGGRDLRERIGILSQESTLGLELTVGETIELFGAAYPAPLPVADVLELVGLADVRGALVRTLSDGSARRHAWSLVEGLRALGKTVLLTTHYMDEAQSLADRVAVIAHGRIVAGGDPALLAGRVNGTAVVRFRASAAMPLPDSVELEAEAGGFVSFRTDAPTRVLASLLTWASMRGEELEGLTVTRPTLEDVYLELTEERAFTPSIAIFALTAGTYTTVVFGVATAREQGVFKRVRGTPLPMHVFLGS